MYAASAFANDRGPEVFFAGYWIAKHACIFEVIASVVVGRDRGLTKEISSLAMV